MSTGNGTYQAGKKIAVPNAGVIAVGDLNGDGHLDLISSDAYVLYGDGKGDFGKPRYYPVASSPYYFGRAWQVFLTDTRNLGRLDVITANEFNGFSVLLNNGSGTFKDGVAFLPAARAQRIATVDGSTNNKQCEVIGENVKFIAALAVIVGSLRGQDGNVVARESQG